MSEILAVLLFGATLAALLAGFPVAFTLAGSALIFAFLGHLAGVFELSLLGTFVPQIFGLMTNGLLVAVPLFVFLGVRATLPPCPYAQLMRLGGRVSLTISLPAVALVGGAVVAFDLAPVAN